MKLYLIGPQGPNQLSTKWLLEERGYAVVCATDVAGKEYAREDSDPPHELFLHRQLHEMQCADAVVLAEDLVPHTGAVLQVMQVARFGGMRVLHYHDLPVQAPSLCRRDEILMERDLVRPPAAPVSDRLNRQLRSALRRMEGWARRFDTSWGWFFTNGNKARRTPVEYDNTTQPLTTA